MSKNIAFIDLKAQQKRIRQSLEDSILKVLDHGAYIMGPEVRDLEERLAEFCGARHAIACSSGTDALALYLMAQKVRPGDAIFVPAFTFVATAEVVAWMGAIAYFVDVLPDTFNIDCKSLEEAIAQAKADGLNPKGIIPVDLYGQPADYPEIQKIADHNDLFVLSDAAQSFGARQGHKNVGTFGHATTTSFYPAKPLGAYGDAGAIFTDDQDLANLMRSLLDHGKGEEKYDNVRIGMNGRLDTIQAAILLEKLAIFKDELEARRKVADRYNQGLKEYVQIPELKEGNTSSWAQYTIVCEDRAALQNACAQAGVPTAIHYPKALSHQEGYARYPKAPGGVGVSERLAQSVLSLPMHPYLEQADQEYIIDVIQKAVGQEKKYA